MRLVNLAELSGSNGFAIQGIDEYDFSGGVSTAGDVNGDGFDDLLIGAPFADGNGQYLAGESYVVFGRDFTGQENLTSTGEAGLNNTASNDILTSGQLPLATGLADGTSITF